MHSYNSHNRSALRDDVVTAVARHTQRTEAKRSKPMGGLQAKLPRLSSSSAPSSSHAQQDGRSTQLRSIEGTDGGVHRPLHPSVARVLDGVEVNRRKDYQSLDRSLKVFLRASNLPGLEYRLKLAGYQTLDDLLDTDAEKLASEGFTRLMAKRLMTALDSYIKRHLDVTGGQPSPFQLVRRGHIGQKIQSDPSDEMKALPNFGKRNVKRQSSSEQVAVGYKRKTNPKPKQRHSAVVRLMSEEQIPSEPIFPNVIDVRDSVFVEQGEESTSEGGSSGRSSVMTSTTTSSSSSSQMIEIGRVVEIHQSRSGEGAGQEEGPAVIPIDTSRSSGMFGEFYMDDVDTPSTAAVSGVDHTQQQNDSSQQEASDHTHQHGVKNTFHDTVGDKLQRTASIPASFWFASAGGAPPPYPERSYVRVRAYSCPPSIVSMATLVEEDVLTVLKSAQDIESIATALKRLASQLLHPQGVGGESGEIVKAVVDLLQTEKSNQKMAVLCCKVLKLLAREGVSPGLAIPRATVVSLLEAMNYHPTSERLQVEGCLALGNVGRTDPSHCDDIVNNGGLQTISLAMENYPSSPQLQVVAMTALAVVLGAVKDARLLLISEHGQVLDTVFQTMQFYPGEPQLQQYACALLAILIAEVGAQIESGVMQLIVEHVVVAMTTQPHNDHVTVWGAKAFSNAADNAIFSDHKLAGRCAELLVEAMAAFPEDVGVVTWCSYALLQLSSIGESGGVVSHVIRVSQLPVYCQAPPTSLSEKARGYLKELEKRMAADI